MRITNSRCKKKNGKCAVYRYRHRSLLPHLELQLGILEIFQIERGLEEQFGLAILKPVSLLGLDVMLQGFDHPFQIDGTGGSDRKQDLGDLRVQRGRRGPCLIPAEPSRISTSTLRPLDDILDGEALASVEQLCGGSAKRRGRSLEAVLESAALSVKGL